MRVLASVLLAALAIGAAKPHTPRAPDARGEAELTKMLAGRVAGPPSDCINADWTDNVTVVPHTALVYRDGARLWVNRPEGGLDQLDDDSILVTKRYTSQLCSIDPVHLVDRYSRFPRGFVSLGRFVPYIKPKPAG